MPTVSVCPSAQMFEQLRKGLLPLPEVEAVTRHLETCVRCAETVQNLPVEDPLADALRGQAARPQPAADAAVEQVMRKLRERHAGAPANETSTACQTEVPGSGSPGGAGNGTESYDFLAAAQQPGELGRLGVCPIIAPLSAMGVLDLS